MQPYHSLEQSHSWVTLVLKIGLTQQQGEPCQKRRKIYSTYMIYETKIFRNTFLKKYLYGYVISWKRKT